MEEGWGDWRGWELGLGVFRKEEIRVQEGTGVHGARAAVPGLVGGQTEQGRELVFAATPATSCPGWALDWALGEIGETVPAVRCAPHTPREIVI